LSKLPYTESLYKEPRLVSSALVLLIGSYLLPGTPPATPLLPAPADEVSEAVDTLVVCAPGLRPALQRWVDYRTGQGHRLQIITQWDSLPALREAVRVTAKSGRLRFLVLVGDVQTQHADVSLHLPTYLTEAHVNTKWGSEPEIATDNWLADLNDDVAPDLAVGRIPADSPGELVTIVNKIIQYEQSPKGLRRRQVNLVAGVGGFGMLADVVLETATRAFISGGIPEGYRTSMTYASWRSPYCPDPRAFRQQAIQRMNEGCLFWVYIGHGHRQGLDWVRVPIGVAPILNLDDVDQVACLQGPPIALFLSCYGAAFDGPEDCLAERLLARPEGPVAAIGGSRVTMPYGMAVLSQGLMQFMFQDQVSTLGEMLWLAKRQALAPMDDRSQRPWLDALARALSPSADDLEGERREHVQMFHLLGDPLTRIDHAHSVEIDVPRSARPGQSLLVKCRSNVTGLGTVELACRRGRLNFTPDRRTQFDGSHKGMQELTDVYLRANDDCWTSGRCETSGSEFEATLQIPQDVQGACAVRVFIQGAKACALGAAVLYVAADPEAKGLDRAELSVPRPDTERPDTERGDQASMHPLAR
jgi:hypothetical protein